MHDLDKTAPKILEVLNLISAADVECHVQRAPLANLSRQCGNNVLLSTVDGAGGLDDEGAQRPQCCRAWPWCLRKGSLLVS
jgi:hypothetical protein